MDVLRSINSGIPFTDRVIAGAESLPIIGNGQSYSDNLAREQSARAQLAQDHPIEMATGRGVGGLVSTLAFPGAIPTEAGLGAVIGAGTKAGLAYGTAQGASDSPNLADVPQTLHDAGMGGLEGGAVGAAGSTLGYGLGKTGNALMDWVTGAPLPISAQGRSLSALADASTADANTRRLVFNAGMPRPPQDFGPQSMTLDSGPAMQQLAQKVASTPEGAPLKAAVINRANNFDRTVSDALPGIIGPDQSALAAEAALQARRTAEGAALQPIFDNARATGKAVDVSPVMTRIDQMMTGLPNGAPEQLALAKAQRILTDTPAVPGTPAVRTPVLGPQGQVIRYDITPGVPAVPAKLVSDPETLAAAKSVIDDIINYGDPAIGVGPGVLSSKDGALSQVRGGIDAVLRGQVPGYGGTMDVLSGLHRQSEGLDYGQSLLNTGKTAINPADPASALRAMPPEEQNAARSGVTSEIYRQAGAPANKTSLDMLNALLPSDTQTGANWNAEKIGQVYGQGPRDLLTELRNQGNQFQTASNTIGGVPAKNAPGVTPSDLGWLGYDCGARPAWSAVACLERLQHGWEAGSRYCWEE